MGVKKELVERARNTSNYKALEDCVECGRTEVLMAVMENPLTDEVILNKIVQISKNLDVIQKARERIKAIQDINLASTETTINWIKSTKSFKTIGFLMNDKRISVKRALLARLEELDRQETNVHFKKTISTYLVRLRVDLE